MGADFTTRAVTSRIRWILFVAVAALFSASSAVAADLPAVAGITEPYLDVTLGASVAGILRTEKFKEGDVIQKGDVILEFDKRLEELEVERRKAVMEQSKREFESTRALLQTTKAVSKEELAKKEAEFAVASAEYAIAQEQLAQRQISAPFPGIITEMLLRPGAACAPHQPLVRLVDTSRCYFVGQVEGKAASLLKVDQEVEIAVDGAARPVTARICFLSPVVDPASGLAKVKAIFENREPKIRPGLTARMVLK